LGDDFYEAGCLKLLYSSVIIITFERKIANAGAGMIGDLTYFRPEDLGFH
jgi:hypothetical protein